MFFSDGSSCREWLKTIPLTNVVQAQTAVLDAIRYMNRIEMLPIERLSCLEMLRDKVAFLLTEQRFRYIAKSIPLSAADSNAWKISTSLTEEMEAGYRRCSTDAIVDTDPLFPHAALIIQRCIRYIGLQMLMSSFLYRRFDPSLWQRLHTQWQDAEKRGIHLVRVRDTVGVADGNSSVTQAYSAVVLGQAANVYELTPRQIEFVDAIMKRFGHKVTIDRAAPANSNGLHHIVDLNSTTGAEFVGLFEENESIRHLNIEDLSRSLRRRIRKLGEGVDLASLDLPTDISPGEAQTQLIRLNKFWCEGEAQRSIPIVPDEEAAEVCFGLNDTHFLLTGQVFEQPNKPQEMTRQQMNDLVMFGKISNTSQRMKAMDVTISRETWGIIDEGKATLRLLRAANSAHGLMMGRILGVKIDKRGSYYLGAVRELLQELDGSIFVGVGMLPGKPDPISARPADGKGKPSNPYTQAFRMPSLDVLKISESLIVPSGMAQIGKGIEILHPTVGVAKVVTVTEFLERGSDYDRVLFS